MNLNASTWHLNGLSRSTCVRQDLSCLCQIQTYVIACGVMPCKWAMSKITGLTHDVANTQDINWSNICSQHKPNSSSHKREFDPFIIVLSSSIERDIVECSWWGIIELDIIFNYGSDEYSSLGGSSRWDCLDPFMRVIKHRFLKESGHQLEGWERDEYIFQNGFPWSELGLLEYCYLHHQKIRNSNVFQDFSYRCQVILTVWLIPCNKRSRTYMSCEKDPQAKQNTIRLLENTFILWFFMPII